MNLSRVFDKKRTFKSLSLKCMTAQRKYCDLKKVEFGSIHSSINTTDPIKFFWTFVVEAQLFTLKYVV